jgi:DNA-binding SARP family transcriptional activator
MSSAPYGSPAMVRAGGGEGGRPAVRLRVDLFGGVRIAVGGQPVAITSAKARALLACLVLGQSGEESREVLSERLWSRSETAVQQRNSLKRDLKALVDAFAGLGFDGLEGRRQTIALDLTRTDSDVLEALRSAERGLAHPALLERERPFDRIAQGADDVDPAFSAWLRDRALTLSASVARALDLALSRAGGDLHRRLDLARAAFNLDRTKQPAAQALMEIHEAMGDPSGALRVYGALYLAHLQEHDEPPSGEILQMVERLKRGLGSAGGPGSGPSGLRETARPPPRLRIAPGEPGAAPGPAVRRVALALIDRLGRRPGLVTVCHEGNADFTLRLLADEAGGAVFLQLWTGSGDRLNWTHRLAPDDAEELAGAAHRVLAVLTGEAAPSGPVRPAASPGPAETFALRLLTSSPATPVPVADPAGGPDSRNDALAEVDRGWRALVSGQRRDALAALRRAAELDPAALEVTGAAALGLALLGEADEAVGLADRLAAAPGDPGIRALRGTALAVCGERRTAARCLADLPEAWLLPRALGAVMADLAGNRSAALACLAPALDRTGSSGDGFCDWALRTLPVPESAEPALLRSTLISLLKRLG